MKTISTIKLPGKIAGVKTTLPIRIYINSYLVPGLVGVLLIMELLDPYRGWVVLLVGLSALWLVSALWARKLTRQLRLFREMRFGWAQVGDRLEERFTLTNTGIVPGLWVEVRDQSNMPGYQVSQVTGVDSFGQTTWRTHSTCTRRGLFTLGPTSLHTGDPFGMYRVEIVDPASTTLLVMPPIVPLPSIEVASGGRSGQARPRSDVPERTVSSSSVREFIPGDSLRYIHWRTTARRETPFVRIFDGTPAGDWWIMLDLDQHVQAGEGWDSTTEYGVILTASLADMGIRMRRAVGLAANSDRMIWLPPAEGSRRRWDILRALALANPGEFSLTQLLNRSASDIGNQASLIIVTPDTDGTWIEALIRLLWRGIVPTVLLLDPASWLAVNPPSRDDEPQRLITNSRKVDASLREIGVTSYIITRDMLDRPEARPGQAGRWEWRVLPTGRAVPVRKPADVTWRALT
jgi:uncharacterized protein (DUF58 family)